MKHVGVDVYLVAWWCLKNVGVCGGGVLVFDGECQCVFVFLLVFDEEYRGVFGCVLLFDG